MKTLHHFLLLPIICSLTANTAFATDRVVSASGTYNTIYSAVLASSDGDRILVASGTYAEGIAISKSISILPKDEGGRFTVTGPFTLSYANGKSITVSGARLMSGITTSGGYSDRTSVRIIDSYLAYCDLDEISISAELYRDTVVDVRISSGTVAGCVLSASALNSTVVRIQGTSVLGEDVWIVGNAIGTSTGGKTGLEVTSVVPFHIENNVFLDNLSGSSAVLITLPADQITPASSIVNNSFIKMTAESFPAVANTTGHMLNLVFKNNAALRFNGMITTISYWPQLVQSNNVLAGPTWINQTTGQPVNGSPLINAGDPDPRYLDLDLTTNDVGCYGGSNSRANFTTPMGSAVVGFMQAPRVVAQGDAVNISVTGFDR